MSWLTEVLPNKNELDEVIICGGTADYLREELDSVFPTTPIVWHGGVEVPQTLNEQWLGNRLADVWALSVYHAIKVRAIRRSGGVGEGESGDRKRGGVGERGKELFSFFCVDYPFFAHY